MKGVWARGAVQDMTDMIIGFPVCLGTNKQHRGRERGKGGQNASPARCTKFSTHRGREHYKNILANTITRNHKPQLNPQESELPPKIRNITRNQNCPQESSLTSLIGISPKNQNLLQESKLSPEITNASGIKWLQNF